MRIEHIAIWTNQLENMKAFYTKYFGGQSNDKYENLDKGFESYFLSFDDQMRLELMSSKSLKEAKAIKGQFIGIAHIAFSTGGKPQVDQLTETLRADGFTIVSEPRITGDGYYESAVLDPDGNTIEITI